jgi:DtxR family Mn-dependent transcriptional regulator
VLPPDRLRCLVDLEPGEHAVVRRVPDGDPALLRYLGDLGVVPAKTVTMVSKAPFGGPVTLDVDGTKQALGVGVAEMIRVDAPL